MRPPQRTNLYDTTLQVWRILKATRRLGQGLGGDGIDNHLPHRVAQNLGVHFPVGNKPCVNFDDKDAEGWFKKVVASPGSFGLIQHSHLEQRTSKHPLCPVLNSAFRSLHQDLLLDLFDAPWLRNIDRLSPLPRCCVGLVDNLSSVESSVLFRFGAGESSSISRFRLPSIAIVLSSLLSSRRRDEMWDILGGVDFVDPYPVSWVEDRFFCGGVVRGLRAEVCKSVRRCAGLRRVGRIVFWSNGKPIKPPRQYSQMV
ncbi:hypothetical protein FA15DRAFT_660985 [Coprinopsis marcescibilis]|uniref:Uncharacterized protein n=1 Tax=Coprinopsis marcescibilis TaxID=230819 RepID=A0A5C3KDA7_COPMA|nr:hypothetical protein FA15DRAFT_660985 [Coprinopsis marcescibilis]